MLHLRKPIANSPEAGVTTHVTSELSARWRSRSNLRGVLLLLTFVVTWAITLFFMHKEERATRERALAQLSSLCASVAMHAERVFGDANQLAGFLSLAYQRSGARGLELAKWNRLGLMDQSFYPQVGVIDAKGMYVASNLADFRPVDLSDRPHFRYHIDSPGERPYLSETLIGRASGRPSIQVSRRISDDSGKLQGVAVVSVSPKYFVDKYADLMSSSGFVGLLGTDGKSRIVNTDDGFRVGERLSQLDWFENVIRPGRHGTLQISGWPKPGPQLMAFQKVEGWPLIAVVGIDEAEAMAPYQALARSYLAAGILLSIILGVAIFSQMRFTQRLRLANRQLRRSAQELQAANASKDRFIAHISHELRTPIAGISSGAELLEMSLEDPELLEDAATIRRASTHLLEIVNNLLTLSRGQADGFRVRVEKVALPELVAEVCQPWLTVCSKKGIALDRQSRVPEGTQVMGDATALRQILQNLISNAVKFTLEGGVKVELTISDAHVRVTVSDTGKGIDPALLPGLFQQFSTLDQWETRDQHGAGLGLYLSQSLARAMETEIRVASEPGRGTAFSIDLPLVQPLTGTPA